MKIIREYWTQILFIITAVIFVLNWIKATKCSLRNDILTIYTQCKDKKEISLYEKQAIHLSYDLYRKLKGNSFVEDIVKEIDTFKVK